MPTYVITTEATQTVRVRSTYTVEASSREELRICLEHLPAPDSEETIEVVEKIDEEVVGIAPA